MCFKILSCLIKGYDDDDDDDDNDDDDDDGGGGSGGDFFFLNNLFIKYHTCYRKENNIIYITEREKKYTYEIKGRHKIHRDT